MRSRILPILALATLLPSAAWSQTSPVEGLRENNPGVHALIGARVVVAPGRVIENATVVVRDGVIEAVGTGIPAPGGARVWDLAGHTIYPGFIDAYSDVGMPAELPGAASEDAAENEEEGGRGAVYWNPQVRAFVDAASVFRDAGDRRAALRSQGFTAAMAVPQLGMFRGQTAAVSLGSGGPDAAVLRRGIAQSVVMERDNRAGGGYPTSAMGAITFIRQVLHDTDWYARARDAYDGNPAGLARPETNIALAALGPAARGEQPMLIATGDEEEYLRALRFAEDFPLRLWIRGSGYEYRLLDELGGSGTPLILPVDFPDAPDVERPEEALDASLEELRHWYFAPENPGRLAGAGVEFALTSDGLDDTGQFLRHLRRAVGRGLAADAALAALTTTPARLLGLERTHGTLEAGKAANLVVATGDLFGGEAEIRHVWVDGERFEVTAPRAMDLRGTWSVTVDTATPMTAELTLEGTPARLSGRLTAGGQDARLTTARVIDDARRLELAFEGGVLDQDGLVRLSASVSGDEMFGWGDLPDGRRVSWRGTRATDGPPDAASANGNGAGSDARAAAAAQALPALDLQDLRPAMEYGRAAPPEQPEHVLVRNATVWTQGPQGIIEGGDVLIRAGQVVEVGQGLQAPAGAHVIDGTGKHVTPGLIDAHLHAGVTGGVNETGSAIVPEVRIGDVLTMNNLWTYRQLAGGLTTAHVMHGSANPIGGQNQIVKMRWGSVPEALKFEGAPRTVKFALGENPKRREDRYPDTRMGTEQIIRDHFQAAREYERDWQAWEQGGQQGIPPRRDLRLESIVDILNGDIQVQSHSYRQDEILMLMRLAEDYDFRIKAFQHGVETYKVAPELAEHGAAASVWSDWSSFKVEAYDGTTYNARLLLDAGVVTSLHSDNSQLASRMNWEAAKTLRTGVGEEDALSLVTSGTARLLGIDDRVGSLEPGKDGDFVLWSASPLSTFTRAEQTWVDGRKYFDIEEDLRLRDQIDRERAAIIQFILHQRATDAEGR
jgi:imidazolonepropionase-like amidohydrolase